MEKANKSSSCSGITTQLKAIVSCKLLLLALLAVPSLGYAQRSNPHRQYRVYRNRTGEGAVSVVVPVSTTDQQLKNLLWFFRKNVRTGNFKTIGILKPTEKRFGKLGYTAGIISVYRGEKCANEEFIDSEGACGYGEHDVASYQWGIDGDPARDAGDIRLRNGELSRVFDYKDGWKPS